MCMRFITVKKFVITHDDLQLCAPEKVFCEISKIIADCNRDFMMFSKQFSTTEKHSSYLRACWELNTIKYYELLWIMNYCISINTY